MKVWKYTNSRTKLLTYYHKFLNIFNWKIAETLASARNKKINYQIKLKNTNENRSESLWKLLYNMSCEKLLTLQKTLTEYLNKNFIHVSNSFISTFVLFVKKLNRELYFCINYHTLNKLMKKNCYFLFLINEILE